MLDETAAELAEVVLVKRGAGVVLGQDALEARVVAFDDDHRIVHDLAEGGLLGAALQVAPVRGRRHPEDVFGAVFVWVFGFGAGLVALAGEPLGGFAQQACVSWSAWVSRWPRSWSVAL